MLKLNKKWKREIKRHDKSLDGQITHIRVKFNAMMKRDGMGRQWSVSISQLVPISGNKVMKSDF